MSLIKPLTVFLEVDVALDFVSFSFDWDKKEY